MNLNALGNISLAVIALILFVALVNNHWSLS